MSSESKIPNYFLETADYNYIPKKYRDLPKADQAMFILKTLSMEEVALIEDSRFGFSGVIDKEEKENKGQDNVSSAVYKRGTELMMAFNMGVKEWHNFKTPKGKDIPYNKQNKQKLAPELWKELGEEVISGSSLTKVEEENLESEV